MKRKPYFFFEKFVYLNFSIYEYDLVSHNKEL